MSLFAADKGLPDTTLELISPLNEKNIPVSSKHVLTLLSLSCIRLIRLPVSIHQCHVTINAAWFKIPPVSKAANMNGRMEGVLIITGDCG